MVGFCKSSHIIIFIKCTLRIHHGYSEIVPYNNHILETKTSLADGLLTIIGNDSDDVDVTFMPPDNPEIS